MTSDVAPSEEHLDVGVRLFNAPRKLRVDGDLVYRPGSRESVWIDTGDGLVLEDDAGEEWARFGDPADHLNQQTWDTTPCVLVKGEGEAPNDYRVVRAPVLPTEGVDDSAWHTLVADDGELTLADETNLHARPADLDVPEGATVLLDLLQKRDDGAPVTVSEAHDLANDSDDERLHKSRRTVSNWIDSLVEADAMAEGEYRANAGREYCIR